MRENRRHAVEYETSPLTSQEDLNLLSKTVNKLVIESASLEDRLDALGIGHDERVSDIRRRLENVLIVIDGMSDNSSSATPVFNGTSLLKDVRRPLLPARFKSNLSFLGTSPSRSVRLHGWGLRKERSKKGTI